MGVLIGALMVVAGIAAVIIAAMGTQRQVFDTLTGHQAPQPKKDAGGGGLPGLPGGLPNLPNLLSPVLGVSQQLGQGQPPPVGAIA